MSDDQGRWLLKWAALPTLAFFLGFTVVSVYIRTVYSNPSLSKIMSFNAHNRLPTEAFLPGMKRRRLGTLRILIHIRVKGGKAELHRALQPLASTAFLVHRAPPWPRPRRPCGSPLGAVLAAGPHACAVAASSRSPGCALRRPLRVPAGGLAALGECWRGRAERRAGSDWASLVLPGGRGPSGP